MMTIHRMMIWKPAQAIFCGRKLAGNCLSILVRESPSDQTYPSLKVAKKEDAEEEAKELLHAQQKKARMQR